MAVAVDVSIIAEVSGLGESLVFGEKFAVTGTVIKAVSNRQIQAVTGTEEALNLCGISTVDLIIIKATTNDLLIDTSFASFTEEINVPEGEVRIIKPKSGSTVYIKNEDASEVCTVDYLIVGSA